MRRNPSPETTDETAERLPSRLPNDVPGARPSSSRIVRLVLALAIGGCAADVGSATSAATDPGCFDPWIGACPTAPRQVAPMSGSRLEAPVELEWENPVNVSSVQLQICSDRACVNPLVDTIVTGESYQLTADFGQVYWRVGYVWGRNQNVRSPFWLLDTSNGVRPPSLDVNGDHLADVVVGDDDLQAAYLFLGQAGGIGNVPSATIVPTVATANFGLEVADAGDVNGDGYRDLIVAAPASLSPIQQPVVFVYLGSASGALALDSTLSRPTASAFGLSAISVGDMDGDGFGDVAIGSPAYGALKIGRVEVFRGGPTGLAAAPTLVLDGAGDAEDNFGVSLGLADLNGDGDPDLVVGEVNASYAALGVAPGRVHVFHGDGSAFAAVPSTTLACPDGDNVGFGFDVSTAGDRDSDGFEDIVVAAFGYATVDGRAYVFPGGPAGVGSTPLQVLDPPTSGVNGYFGFAVDGGDDPNRDGIPDIIVGETDALSTAGRAHVFYGATRGPGTRHTLPNPVRVSNAYFGQAVSMPGDLDGDQVDDLVVGAPGGSGAMYAFDGVNGGLVSTVPSAVATGAGNGRFGIALTR